MPGHFSLHCSISDLLRGFESPKGSKDILVQGVFYSTW